MGKLESQFQSKLKKKLAERFPGCVVMKNDPNDIQGIPDLTVLYGPHWATLECKRSDKAKNRQPNQEYYVNKMNEMSFSRFIFPENMEEVLDEMERSFEAGRNSCVLESESANLA